jgi:hypothetical protein
MPVPAIPFSQPTLMEQHIDARLRAAPRDGRGMFSVDAGGLSPEISGEFLRWLLLEAIPELDGKVSLVELKRITVTSVVDLEGAKLAAQVRFVACHFREKFNLNDASVIGLFFISGRARQIEADRLNASGSLEIRKSVTPEEDTGGFEIDYRLRLCGADIRGNLDLRGCRMHGERRAGEDRIPLFADGLTVKSNVLLSDGFKANGEVRLNGAKIRRNLDCAGASLRNAEGYSLSAAGAAIEGTTYLCRTPDRVREAERRPFVSIGTVRLEGAKIDGDLDCGGGKFVACPFLTRRQPPPAAEREWLYAIRANGLTVGADLKLTSSGAATFRVRGAISLINATIGDDFECVGGVFDLPGEEILVADGITVGGTTFLTDAKVNGLLRFPQASLKEGIYANRMTFDAQPPLRDWFGDDNVSRRTLGRDARGLYAPQANVGGSFIFRDARKRVPELPLTTNVWLYLRGAHTNTVRDDAQSWQLLDHFEIDGARYETLENPDDFGWRIAELDRRYAPLNAIGSLKLFGATIWRALTRNFKSPPAYSQRLNEAIRRFKPQPYLQLARACRAAGYEAAANDILVHYQRNKTRYSDFGALRQIGRWLVDLFLLYGFSPFRPLVYLAVWAVISAALFELAYVDGKILPTKDLQQFVSPPYTARPRFNALLYAVDTLVPVVDFNQKKSWAVEAIGDPPVALPHQPLSYGESLLQVWHAIPQRGAATLLVVNTFFGWLMTSLFVAGVGGLLRSGREEG